MATGSRPEATLSFFVGWHEDLRGDLAQGGRLTVEYDPERLPDCRGIRLGVPSWDIRGFVRFSPSGQHYEGSLVRRLDGSPVEPAQAMPLSVPVPVDARQAELWFQNIDARFCMTWDSRYGQNYWHDVSGRGPLQSVNYRLGAIPSLAMVNVVAAAATKRNAFPRPATGPPEGSDLQSWLTLTAWVNNVAFEKNVWIDVHVFDGEDALLQAETLTLRYLEPGGGGGDLFVFNSKVYQGSVATPGSVSPRPDARLVQYRLYYEVNGQVFTDAILHQLDLPEDAVSTA
jgi:Family of unknown function (DUF6209)